MTTPSSLLIVHPGALGDIVCIFPIVSAFRRYYHPVAALCQSQVGRLAKAERLVDAWFPIEAAWVGSLFTRNPAPEARRALAPFAHILVFSKSSTLSSSLQHIAGARIGRISPRPPVGQRVHVAEHALAGILEHGWLPEAAAERIPMRMSAPGPQDAVLDGHGLKTVLLHPGAGSPRKRWPLAGFLEVAAQIKARRLNPEYVIGPADHDLLPELERCGAAIHRPADCLHLLNLFRSAAAYVGNDSGASHLAAWASLPSVVIFGPTDPVRWRPQGRSVEILQPPLECMPCFENATGPCAAEDCLKATAPQDVLEALERLILAKPFGTSAGRKHVLGRPH
jgi:ADP-heptose:LPS heptosyltransferase